MHVTRLKFSIGKVPFGRFLLGLGLLFFLFWSYFFYIHHSRKINYRIFNIEETVSWEETKEGIYRTEAQGELDNQLISIGSFKEFSLSFDLKNPHDCGVILHYQDPEHYDLVYFYRPKNAILFVTKEGERSRILKFLPFPDKASFNCHLKVMKDKSRFILTDTFDEILPFNNMSGGMAILINDAQEPVTVFENVTLAGTLSNGQTVKGVSPPRFQVAGQRYLGVLLPFFLALMLLSLYLAKWILPWMAPRQESHLKDWHINTFTAMLIHLGLAALIFGPFILRGENLVSSYDNIGEIFPLFFFSKHRFTQMLSEHSWLLWNPLFHNGTPFWSSHWNMLYDPLNWPIFFLADSQVMFALTLRTLIQVFLIGILAYGFFLRELGSARWALFSSITYQLCSFLIFSFSIFPTISLYFAMTLYWYVLWSMPGRRALWNYVLITLAVYLVLTGANVVFVFYAVLCLAAVSIYRLYSVKEQARPTAGIVLSGFFTAGLLSTVRLLPCFWGIWHSNRIVEDYYTLHDRAFLFIRFFIPEIVGWFGPDTFNALTSTKLRLVFKPVNLPSNSQNTFFIYFGILAALLLIVSYLVRFKKRYTFWKVYSFVVISVGLLWQPVWGILSILFFPLNHYSYHIVIIPVGICALVGHTGLYLEKERIRLKKIGRPLWFILVFIEVYILIFLTYLAPQITPVTRAVFLLFIGVFILYKLLRDHARPLAQKFLCWLQVFWNSIVWVLFFFASTILLLRPFPRKEELGGYFIIPFLSFLALLVAALYLYYYFTLRSKGKRLPYAFFIVFALVVPLATGCLFQAGLFKNLLQLTESYRTYISDILLAHVRFFLIIQLAILSYVLARLRMLRMHVVVGLLILVAALDLLGFNFRFDNVSAPFYYKKAFYIPGFGYMDISTDLRKQLDLINYRAHAQDRVGLNANKGIIYDIPSYVGTLGYLSARFSNFITGFGFDPGAVLIYPADVFKDDRFLDLSAVRYEFLDMDTFKERPTALARLNLFYGYEVMPEDDSLSYQTILSHLSDPSFDIHKIVLLSTAPAVKFTPAVLQPAKRIPILSATSDKITARIVTPTPVIILFSESYDEGWKAFVDGASQPVLRANYNFMAVAVAPGEHEIIFQYKPELFFASLGVSLGAWVIFVLLIPCVFLSSKLR